MYIKIKIINYLMVNYECKRCGFSTNIRTKYYNHLRKKKVCKPLISNIKIEELREQLDVYINRKANLTLEPPPSQNTHNSLFNTSQNIQKSNIESEAKIEIKCVNCGLTFTRKDNLKRHISKYCKNVNIINKEVKNCESSTINNIINNNNVCTINNNITINNYGTESIEHLLQDTRFINSLLKGPYTAIPRMIEAIHFDREHPENMNVRIQNKKEPWILVFKEGKWNHERKTEVLDDIIDKSYNSFDMEYPNQKQSLNNIETNRYDSFQTKMDEKNIKLYRNMRKDAEKIILNNRDT